MVGAYSMLIFVKKGAKDTNSVILETYELYRDIFLRDSKSKITVYRLNGKPFLENFNGHISVSHSGDYVVCAISKEKVGIDLEKITSLDFKKISNRFFPFAIEDSISFYKHWCAAEAWAKAEDIPLIQCLKDKYCPEKVQYFDLIKDYSFCYYGKNIPFFYFS